jgi:cold shock protein
MRGIVKWYDSKKKYGFIVNDKGEDVFFHCNEIQVEGYRDIDRGAEVGYEEEVTPRGIKGVRVKPTGEKMQANNVTQYQRLLQTMREKQHA